MKNIYLTLFFVFLVSKVQTQVTFIVNQIPQNTSKDAQIYISGNFDNWSGGQNEYVLTKIDSTIYKITLKPFFDSIEFKFTCGNWEKVEKDSNFEEIKNRTYFFDKKIDTVYFQIHNWNNKNDKIETTMNHSVLIDSILIFDLKNNYRTIRIYLPSDYYNSTQKYPVIYMHDGQNLYDNSTSYAGEWCIDETMRELEKKYNFKAIIVGIDNGGNTRIDEYTPWKNSKYGGGNGEIYTEFIIKKLKPYIDKNFRTLRNSENTGIIGSSLGGLISFYAILKYPKVFGKAGVFSPSFWFSDSCYTFAQKSNNFKKNKIYFLAGTDEDENMVPDLNKMYNILSDSNKKNIYIFRKIVPKAKHNEYFWKSEFENCIIWLFELK